MPSLAGLTSMKGFKFDFLKKVSMVHIVSMIHTVYIIFLAEIGGITNKVRKMSILCIAHM